MGRRRAAVNQVALERQHGGENRQDDTQRQDENIEIEQPREESSIPRKKRSKTLLEDH